MRVFEKAYAEMEEKQRRADEYALRCQDPSLENVEIAPLTILEMWAASFRPDTLGEAQIFDRIWSRIYRLRGQYQVVAS